MKRHVLVLDYNTTFGRAVLAHYNGERLQLEDVHRFENEPVCIGKAIFWDILRLLHELKTSLLRANFISGLESLAIDAWGRDYGLLDTDGVLLCNPQCKQEIQTEEQESLFPLYSADKLYEKTGILPVPSSILFQLSTQNKTQPALFALAETMLPIADLLAYFLTGVATTDAASANTTQLYNITEKTWDTSLCKQFPIPETILPEIVPCASYKGTLTPAVCQELGIPSAKVLSVCGKGTQCAALAIPAEPDQPFLFLQCGISTLFGTELQEPILTEQAASLGFSNLTGYNNTITFQKRIAGLFLIQETRRYYREQGETYSYAKLEELALAATPLQCFIDPNNPIFLLPGNLPQKIQMYCRKTEQYVPKNVGEIIRCIYESLALQHRKTMEEIQTCTNISYSVIHVVGIGAKDPLLCQMTADICQIPVISGPIDATIYGNAALQLLATGVLADTEHARRIISQSEKIRKFTPETDCFDSYKTFSAILKKAESLSII